jgi:hypothetical protein
MHLQAKTSAAEQAAEKLGIGQEWRTQGLRPDGFSIIYGTTKAVP